jgi:hypothetical protein
MRVTVERADRPLHGGCSNENLVKPVERDTIDRRAIHHLAMIACSLRSRKPDEILLASQGVEQRLSSLSQGVIVSCGRQRRAANGFRAILRRVALDLDEIVAQIGFAIRPETSLYDLPAQIMVRIEHVEVLANALKELIDLIGTAKLADARADLAIESDFVSCSQLLGTNRMVAPVARFLSRATSLYDRHKRYTKARRLS